MLYLVEDISARIKILQRISASIEVLWTEHGVENLTFEGKLGDFEKYIYMHKVCLHPKRNSCTRPYHCRKKFTHVRWAERKTLLHGRKKPCKQNSLSMKEFKKIMIPNHPTHPQKWNGPPLRRAVAWARSVFHVARILSLYYYYEYSGMKTWPE